MAVPGRIRPTLRGIVDSLGFACLVVGKNISKMVV